MAYSFVFESILFTVFTKIFVDLLWRSIQILSKESFRIYQNLDAGSAFVSQLCDKVTGQVPSTVSIICLAQLWIDKYSQSSERVMLWHIYSSSKLFCLWVSSIFSNDCFYKDLHIGIVRLLFCLVFVEMTIEPSSQR